MFLDSLLCKRPVHTTLVLEALQTDSKVIKMKIKNGNINYNINRTIGKVYFRGVKTKVNTGSHDDVSESVWG